MINEVALVTVIVPVYDIATYLPKCLESILMQTHKNLEIILVDDGSTDNSDSICAQYAEKDKRFIHIRQKNSGVSSARNTGLDAANGDFITFVDGDDIIAPTYVEHLLHMARDGRADITGVGFIKSPQYTDISVEFGDSEDKQYIFTADEAAKCLLHLGVITNNVWGKMFRRDVLHTIRFDTTFAVGEDMELMYRAICASEKIIISNRRLYQYLLREGSAMNSGFSEKRVDAYRAAKSMVSYGSPAHRSALHTKLFTESFWLGLRLIDAKAEHKKLWNECMQDIRLSSRFVILNRSVRLPRRLYAAMSFFTSPSIAVFVMHPLIARKEAKR